MTTTTDPYANIAQPITQPTQDAQDSTDPYASIATPMATQTSQAAEPGAYQTKPGGPILNSTPAAPSGTQDTGVWAGVKRNTVGAVEGIYHALKDPVTPEEQQQLLQKINDYNQHPDVRAGKVPRMSEESAQNPSTAALAYHRIIDAPADVLLKKGKDEVEAAKDLLSNHEYWRGGNMYLSGLADKVLSVVPAVGPAINQTAKRYESGDTSGAATDIGAAWALENAGELTKKPLEVVKKAVLPKPATAPELVGRITQATGPDVETAANALKTVDTSQVKTFKDLNNVLVNQVRQNTAKVDAALGKYSETFKPGDLETKTPVEGRTDIVASPINDALDQLQDFYVKTKDAANQAKIEGLQSKLESNGLTVKDINDLARQHGRDLNAYNANGELASGLSKQAAENTRQGVKDIVRKLTPDETTKTLDKNTSDLITTREMISDMNEKVQALQNKFEKAGLVQRIGAAAGKAVDWGTQGLFKGIFKSVVGAAEQEGKTLNVIQIENNLRKNLDLLDKLNKMETGAAFRELSMGGSPVNPVAGLTALQMAGKEVKPSEGSE